MPWARSRPLSQDAGQSLLPLWGFVSCPVSCRAFRTTLTPSPPLLERHVRSRPRQALVADATVAEAPQPTLMPLPTVSFSPFSVALPVARLSFRKRQELPRFQGASQATDSHSRWDSHVLVTGGAGYIGSHAALLLMEEGYHVTVLDNLSRGNKGAIDALQREALEGQFVFVNADLGDRNKVCQGRLMPLAVRRASSQPGKNMPARHCDSHAKGL